MGGARRCIRLGHVPGPVAWVVQERLHFNLNPGLGTRRWRVSI